MHQLICDPCIRLDPKRRTTPSFLLVHDHVVKICLSWSGPLKECCFSLVQGGFVLLHSSMTSSNSKMYIQLIFTNIV